MLLSSAYRANRSLRRSNSRSNSSSTMLLSRGDNTPRTQEAISNLKEQLWDGEKGTHCLIGVVNSNTIMSNDSLDQDGKGSPAECRSRAFAASNRASQSSASVGTRVRLVRAPSISLPARSLATRSTDRSSRSHCANYLEASAAN